MPKTSSKPTAEETKKWVESLPNNGGTWGKGIISMLDECELELEDLENQKAEIEERLKGRKKLIRETIKRAGKEAHTLFPESTIKQAQSRAESQIDREASPSA